IAIGILLVTALPARLIKQSIIRRQKGADRYLILASRHSSSDSFLDLLANGVFVAATLIATPKFGSAAMTQIGELGLALLLVGQLIGDFDKRLSEVLEICQQDAR